MTTFADANALIYGAAKGIGRAVAQEFARRGARVAVADIDLVSAQETAAGIIAAGGQAVALRCDVTSETGVQEAAVAAEIALGDIAIVMNNVGAIMNGNPEDVPVAEWVRILDLNLLSVVRSNAVWLPRLLAQGRGHIVNTASFAGLFPYATTRMPYVASKAAVVALSESLALYLHPQGVRVSCLCPGPVMTAIAETMKQWSAHVVMQGPGSALTVLQPEQVAVILADGMEAGRVIIPSHAEAWEIMRRHAADPDAYIAAKIAAVAVEISGSRGGRLASGIGAQRGLEPRRVRKTSRYGAGHRRCAEWIRTSARMKSLVMKRRRWLRSWRWTWC